MRFSKPSKGKNGLYYVRETFANGKRGWKATGTDSYREACQIVEGWLKEAPNPTISTSCTVQEGFSQWVASKEGRCSQGVKEQYELYSKLWVRELGGDRKLRDVTTGDVEKFLQNRRKTAEAITVNSHLRWLRGAWKFFTEHDLVLKNVVSVIRKFPESVKRVKVITAEEETRLLERAAEMASPLFYGAVLCLCRSGMRRGTVENLREEHVDWEKGFWNVPSDLMKMREAFQAPIEPSLFDWLKANHRPGLLFGTIPQTLWRATVHQANLDGLRIHDLRRSFLTRLRQAGVQMETAMKLGAWRSVSTALHFYRAVTDREMKTAITSTFQDTGEKVG